MRIRLTDGPCKGEHDLRIAPQADPPGEFLVLVEAGPRQKVSDINGGTIPGVNEYAVHRFRQREADGTPIYGFSGRRWSRGY